MQRGGWDYIRATGLDSGGHHTQRAYEFTRPRTRVMTPDGRLAYVFALKGTSGPGQVWPREASVANVGKIPLWIIRVDPAKELIYARLQKVVEPGPGYIHIPDTPTFNEQWAKQLTAEKMTERTNRKGFPENVWELKSQGRRNEVLDCAVYSYAALCGLRAMGLDLDVEANSIASLTVESPPERGYRPTHEQSTPSERPARPQPANGRVDQSWVQADPNWLRRR
jgi:phage terminase large subunit GpA-like protein